MARIRGVLATHLPFEDALMPLIRFIPILVALLVVTTACSSGRPKADVWPTVDALPSGPPSDLDVRASATSLRRASDGFLYIVGGIPDSAASGSTFHARYSGEWPLADLPRPALARGTVLRTFGDEAAIVSLDYQFPNASLEGLEISWDTPTTDEKMGKGIATVLEANAGPNTDLRLDVGTDVGVQPGDIYAIMKPATEIDDPTDVQVPRRLTNICLVDSVADESATCRLWRGSRYLIGSGITKVGDDALFLEHTFGREPRKARIAISKVEGDDGGARDALVKLFREYVESIPNSNIEVVDADFTVDATREDFYRYDQGFEHEGIPTLIVGASIEEKDGKRRFMLNYTGTGPISGPGMVAAPPEHGVAAGTVDNLDPYVLRAFVGTVFGGVLVYRGQTSEALMHLHLLLRDDTMVGPLRWHVRDQYAMRWAALGNTDLSIWLVQEDERVAQSRDDQQAYLNALGTRVRLLDMVGQSDAAVEASAEFLAALESKKPSVSWLSAVAMHAEMLTAAGDLESAQKSVDRLLKACPSGCNGDLNMLLGGVFWSLPDDADEYRTELLDELVRMAKDSPTERLAAVRMYQGILKLRDETYDEALIDFLEAERLFDEVNDLSGVSRAKFYNFVTQLRRQEPQKAFETALESLEATRELRDFDSAARTYEALTGLYRNLDPNAQPGPYLAAAKDVMLAAIRSQLARGDFGGAAGSFFSLGVFLVRIGELDDSQAVLQQGVLFAIRSAKFDVASLAHLYLGLIARAKGDEEMFYDEIGRAKTMGGISDDPSILETIEEALKPPEPEAPTQVL